jgi:membrane protein YdbS with pleckstrin-like domain
MFFSVTLRNYILCTILFISFAICIYSMVDLKKRWKMFSISLVIMIISLVVYHIVNFYMYGCKWKCKKICPEKNIVKKGSIARQRKMESLQSSIQFG